MGLSPCLTDFIVTVAPSHDGRRASPSRGPPTVAPAEEPTTTRKVGASTPHRRPSASGSRAGRRSVPAPTLQCMGRRSSPIGWRPLVGAANARPRWFLGKIHQSRAATRSPGRGLLAPGPEQFGFCLLFVFASAWGQTFLLSVFQPYWMRASAPLASWCLSPSPVCSRPIIRRRPLLRPIRKTTTTTTTTVQRQIGVSSFASCASMRCSA